MKIGDIVECEGQRWRVYKEDKHVKTVTLLRWGGAIEEVALDDPRVTFVCDPGKWPFVTAKVNLRAGPLTEVILARGARPRSLRPFMDWVPSDHSRAGGSIFLSPQLKLKLGEVLVGVHTNGTRVRLPITREFGTMTSRKNRRSVLPERRDLVDYLDGEDFVVE
jgi:hypothetical protein